jgi:hypothetical protein
MTQVTPWFPAKTKPHHIGAYEITCRDILGEYYSWWDGRRFNSAWSSLERAEMHKCFGSHDRVVRWRGLAEEPTNG